MSDSVTPANGTEQLPTKQLHNSLQKIKPSILTAGWIYPSVKGLYEKHFEGAPWYAAASDAAASLVKKISQAEFDAPPLQESSGDLAGWVNKVGSFVEPNRSLHVTCPDKVSGWNQGVWPNVAILDPAVSTGDAGTGDVTVMPRAVQLFGYFSEPSMSYNETVVVMAAIATNVFFAQPTRLLLHGFSITGTTMQLWTFHRGGAQGGALLDLCSGKDLEKGITALAGYLMMRNDELGLNPSLRQATGEGGSVAIVGDEEIKLEGGPFLWTSDLVEGRSMALYKGTRSSRPNEVVTVKYLWHNDPTEHQFLRRVRERKVWGVVQQLEHREVVSVTDLHAGLDLGPSFKFE